MNPPLSVWLLASQVTAAYGMELKRVGFRGSWEGNLAQGLDNVIFL
jgi:hypothetical protein